MSKQEIGKKIMKFLTDEQTARLLSACISTLSESQRQDVLGGLQADIATTVRNILKKGDKKKKKKDGRPSTAKYLEIWHQLWNQWRDLVIEVGDEEGRYAYQDVHWEPPCFDCGSLADDLDEVAEKMLPLLDTIHNTGEEDLEIFAEAIDEIEDNIKSYPEWMCDFDHEEIYVGPAVTRCLLTWEKLHADSAASFAGRLADLEAGWRCLLDTKAFIDFLDDFSSEQKQEIYEFITENRGRSFWQERLASPWSGWHHVYHDIDRDFSTAFCPTGRRSTKGGATSGRLSGKRDCRLDTGYRDLWDDKRTGE